VKRSEAALLTLLLGRKKKKQKKKGGAGCAVPQLRGDRERKKDRERARPIRVARGERGGKNQKKGRKTTSLSFSRKREGERGCFFSPLSWEKKKEGGRLFLRLSFRGRGERKERAKSFEPACRVTHLREREGKRGGEVVESRRRKKEGRRKRRKPGLAFLPEGGRGGRRKEGRKAFCKGERKKRIEEKEESPLCGQEKAGRKGRG